jgi:hypothetical protein
MSRKYRLPLRLANGFARSTSVGGGSLDVTAVRPLDPVVLSEILLDRPAASPRPATAAYDSPIEVPCLLREPLLPEFEEDLRLAWAMAWAACAWARALVVWFAACL